MPLCVYFHCAPGSYLHRRGEPERDQVGERFRLLRGRPGGLAEPGRVREDLGDREVRGLARGGFQARKLGQVFRDRIADVELALVLQHEHCGARDWLRHGRDPEQRVGRHRPFRGDVGETGRFEVEDLVLRDDRRDGAGDFVLRDHLLHRRADARELWLLGEGGQRGGEGKDGREAVGHHGEEIYLFCPCPSIAVARRSRRTRPNQCCFFRVPYSNNETASRNPTALNGFSRNASPSRRIGRFSIKRST